METHMRHPLTTPLLGLLLATSLMLPARSHAGDLNSSEASVLITSVLIVSIPLAASTGLSNVIKEPLQASARRHEAARRKPARPLPDMEVKSIESRGNERCVELQVPGRPDQTASLRWPRAEGHDPASRFAVGQTVQFKETGKGSGWTVRDAQDQLLAYVPTEAAAADNLSSDW